MSRKTTTAKDRRIAANSTARTPQPAADVRPGMLVLTNGTVGCEELTVIVQPPEGEDVLKCPACGEVPFIESRTTAAAWADGDYQWWTTVCPRCGDLRSINGGAYRRDAEVIAGVILGETPAILPVDYTSPVGRRLAKAMKMAPGKVWRP